MYSKNTSDKNIKENNKNKSDNIKNNKSESSINIFIPLI